MNDKEKYPLLIGRSMIGNRRLHNTDEAADFICNTEIQPLLMLTV